MLLDYLRSQRNYVQLNFLYTIFIPPPNNTCMSILLQYELILEFRFCNYFGPHSVTCAAMYLHILSCSINKWLITHSIQGKKEMFTSIKFPSLVAVTSQQLNTGS